MPKNLDNRNASPEHLAAQQENDRMAVVLACEAAFLDHPFQGRFLIDYAIRHAQRTEQRLSHLLEHEQLRSRDTTMIAEVAAVRGKNTNRCADKHDLLP